MKQKITFKELAKISDVSIGTLSRYFNNGPISKKNIEIISANIKKYKFIKNLSASKIRGKSKETIILRTVVISSSLDNIVAGIIHGIKENVSVRYPGEKEEEIINGIKKALSDKPKHLIIFAPTDSTSKLNKIIKEAEEYTKIVALNIDIKSSSTINVNYKKAFDDLYEEHKKINFIYDNKNDIETYINRINNLEKSKIDINISKDSSQKLINFFQNEKLYNDFGFKNKTTSLIISYKKPINYNNNVKWIFVDYFLIGIQIANLCLSEKKDHKFIDAKFVK